MDNSIYLCFPKSFKEISESMLKKKNVAVMQYNNIHQRLGKKKKKVQLALNMKITIIQPKVNRCTYGI